LPLSLRALLEEKSIRNLIWGAWASVYKIYVVVIGIKRFDYKTKVKTRLERQNLQTTSQLCTKQIGTGEINQIIESLLKVECPKNSQNIFNRNLRRKKMFLVST